ncbi:MAG: limonene-1,2-epoxide hydrolase family protein [Pseudomonadales bacterium]
MVTSTLSTEQKKEIFREMAQAWEAKDWQKCASLIAPDGVLHSVMLDPCVGRQAFLERIEKAAKPNKHVKLHIQRMGIANEALFVERIDEIIIDGVGRSVPTVGILEFDGALISLWREYYDRPTLLKALGLSADPHAQG